MLYFYYTINTYNAALEAYGEEILKALQLKPIDPDEVNLTPELIRFNK